MAFARTFEEPVPLFVISNVLRMIANNWDGRPLAGAVADRTKSAVTPGIHALVDELTDWPKSRAIGPLMSDLVTALFESDYRDDSLT